MGGVAAKSLVAGRYELESLLGRGGMGEVWRARHVALNTHWAIKFLHSASAERESARKRFETEAQVTAQLKTRHAVQVFDFGVVEGGQPYLVMELLDGETVGHRLERQGRLPLATTVRFLSQVARALERAHALGIVHRDLKPDNLVVVADEEGREYIKVLDFGIAKLLGALEAEPEEDNQTLLRTSHHSFTRTGNILGTPYYMAPEQIRDARNIDLRADIWAFGIVAYECLTGLPPFEGKDVFELFERIQAGVHVPASDVRPKLPRAFDMWFDIACAVDPSKRFASAKVAATHLSVALDEPVSADVSSGGQFNSGREDSLPPPADASRSPTLDDDTFTRGKVLSRRRRSGRDRSIGKVSASKESGLGGSGVNPTARTVAQSHPPPRPEVAPAAAPVRKPDRRALYAASAAVATIVGLLGWTALRSPRTGTAQTSFMAVTLPAQPAVSATAKPPDETAITPAPPVPATIPSASAATAVPGSSARQSAMSTVRAMHPAALATATTPPVTGSSLPNVATSPPAASAPKTRATPSSASPFELPPLGI